jgi:KUP system potassium uptake protein
MAKKQHKEPSRALGALGVVFGDIGTSPLYAVPAAFFIGSLTPDHSTVVGIISMILWAVTLIVALKYIGIMMRMDNEGEGGVMALVALLRRMLGKRSKRAARNWAFVGVAGVALFYGDSVITPAISVLSAVEGTQLILPDFAMWTAPIAVAVLTILFMAQAKGTGRLGEWFGPLMVGWFVVTGFIGLVWILRVPEALVALSPLTALSFMFEHPLSALLAGGAVVLSVTGAEALYADMGHFGRKAIAGSWFGLVYPALVLNYLGQGAMLLQEHTGGVVNTYFHLFPGWSIPFVVVLATLATCIASQSVIAGAFSLTRQAVRLGYLPRLHIMHPTDEAGQVYVAGLNWLMYTVVIGLVIAFGSSAKLSDAYGMAESGTLFASSILLLVVAPYVWKRSWPLVRMLGVVFLVVEFGFIVACLAKLLHGAWVPLVIAGSVLFVLTTWARGSEIVASRRRRREGSLNDFLHGLRKRRDVVRVPGVAVYLAHHRGYTPLALRAAADRLHELNRSVVVAIVEVENVPRIPLARRAEINNLGNDTDGVIEVVLHFGFDEVPNVPLALEHLEGLAPELKLDIADATYFISESDVVFNEHAHSAMGYLRAQLFSGLHRVSAPSPTYFRLPPGRTIDMAAYVEL